MLPLLKLYLDPTYFNCWFTEQKVELSNSEVDANEGSDRTSNRSGDEVDQMTDQMTSRMADQIADHMATRIVGQFPTQHSRRIAEQMLSGPSVVRRGAQRRTQTEAQTQTPELDPVRILGPLSSRPPRPDTPEGLAGLIPEVPGAAMPSTAAQNGSTFSNEGGEAGRESSSMIRPHFRASGARTLANWIMDRRRQRQRRRQRLQRRLDSVIVEGVTVSRTSAEYC